MTLETSSGTERPDADEDTVTHSRRQTIAWLTTVTAGAGTLGTVRGDDLTGTVPDADGDRAAGLTTEHYSQTTKFAPESGGEDDEFGRSVAVSDDGTTAIVGAPRGANVEQAEADTGAAHVLELADGGWTRRATFTATESDSDEVDLFGSSVSISGDGTTAVVGAHGLTDDSAYVFGRSDGEWRRRTVLEGGFETTNFGRSTALSGDGATAAVGAPTDDEPNGERAGSVYVFERSGGSWDRQQKLAADDGGEGDEFGGAVAMSDDGSTVLVGAKRDDDPHGYEGGSAYVFDREGGTWTQRSKLVADDGEDRERFGDTVALSGDGTTVLVGLGEGVALPVYVYERGDGGWTQRTKVTPRQEGFPSEFGRSLSVARDGTVAVVGAPGADSANGAGAGSAYVFGRGDGEWTQWDDLLAADGDDEDQFGRSVSLSNDGTTVVAGAPLDEDPNGEVTDGYPYRAGGAAYVFEGPAEPPRDRESDGGDDGGTDDDGTESDGGDRTATGADDGAGSSDGAGSDGGGGGFPLPGPGAVGGVAGLLGGVYWLFRRSEERSRE
jgi:hypothetical protein